MENPEEVLQTLDEFTKLKPKEIPKELEDYLSYVAKTGDPVYQWSLVKCLFREKLLNVITDFYEGCPSVELPPCPNVDTFNYETMKDRLIERLELFASAPFTVQRLCELLTSPKKQYSRADKFMRAVEKNIMVVSTREPGQVRRVDSSQPELVNGVADTTENEPSRVGLGLALPESVGSSATTATTASFLNAEGSVQVIFEDSSMEKNHTKCYEESYEDGVPRRASGWFRDRVESPDKITPFGSQIHSHVAARISEENDVDVGNQLAATEKYHGPVADRGMVEEEEEDDIDDDYIEPTPNVQHFPSQDSNPTPLDLEGAEDYCSPPSPEEENSETSAAVSTIAGEDNSISDTSTLEEGEPLQEASPLPTESSLDIGLLSTESISKTSDLGTEDLEPVSLETANPEEKPLNPVTVSLQNTNPTTITETTSIVTETHKLSKTETGDMEADSMSETSDRPTPETVVRSETTDVDLSKCEIQNTEIVISNCASPEPIAIEALESEAIASSETTHVTIEEPIEPTIEAFSDKVIESIPVCETECSEPQTSVAGIKVIDDLEPIAPEESPNIIVSESPAEEDQGLSLSKPPSEGASDSTLTGTLLTAAQNEVQEVSELPFEVSKPEISEAVPDIAVKVPEIVTSLEEERDREMIIQNERVESVIQENVEQVLPQEEILMQQIFVPNETPMDEKTSESEPEAMDVDETSQTVEEPMEQGDNSPTIS